MKTGKVWLVGAGPSDAGLITVKALQIIKKADVVVYDKLVGVEILCLIPSHARRIDVGKRSNNHPVPQERINQILLEEARAGKQVVRLKGGDPFLFGRGGEELELISRHGIPFEIVPGITSALAVPAYAGIPVTHRDYCSSLHIITGHSKEGELPNIDFNALSKLTGTMVFLMGVAALEQICLELIQAGMDPKTPAAIIESGTTSRQRKVIATLESLYEEAVCQQMKAPSVIVVGQVCTLAEDFSWVERRLLHGVRVVITRPQKLCSVLSEKIRVLGGEAIEFPCIETQPITDEGELLEIIKQIRKYNWLVFTSATGVEVFLEKLRDVGRDIRELYGLKLAAVGNATAEVLKQRGVRVDYIPDSYEAKQLGMGLAALVKDDEKVLILRAEKGSKELNYALNEANVHYVDFPIYKTVINTEGCEFSQAVIESGDFDYAAFTSASAVQGFVKSMPLLDYTRIKALCIGEQTAEEAQQAGMTTIISTKATLDSMVETLIQARNFPDKNLSSTEEREG